MIGVVDRLFREGLVVKEWLESQKGDIGVTPITWLEIMRTLIVKTHKRPV